MNAADMICRQEIILIMRDKTGDSVDRPLMTELRSLHFTSLTAAPSDRHQLQRDKHQYLDIYFYKHFRFSRDAKHYIKNPH